MDTNNTQLFRKQGQSQVVDTQGNLVPFYGNLDTLPVYNQQNNAITPDALSPKTKIDLSGIYPTQPTGDGLVTGVADSTKAFDTEAAYKKELELQKLTKPDSTELDSYLKGLLGAEQGLTGRGAAQSEAEIAAGIPEAQKARSSIQGRLKVMLAEYDAMKKERDQLNADIEAGAGRKGLTTGAVLGQQGAVERQYLARLNSKASEIGILQAQDEALKGDIETAQKTVDRAIDLKYQDREAEYTAWKNAYDRVKGTFDAEEKKRGEALATVKKKEEEALAEQKQNEKDINLLGVEIGKNGAPSSVVSSVMQAKTYDEAVRLAGSYLQNPKEKLEIQKLRNEINAAKAVGADTSTIADLNTAGGMGGSILKQAGISIAAFNYLTQGTASMSRMNEATRKQIMNEATNFLNKNGLDVSTFQSRYKAYNDVLTKNISRFNNTVIAEGEILGTIENLSAAADEKDFGRLKVSNVAKLLAGEQVNDPTTLKYAVHLNQLVNELAQYNAAVQGKTSPDLAELEEAKRVIKNGISSGSLKGFTSAMTASVDKMDKTLQGSVDRASKQVWDLFGVGDKYQSPNKDSALQSDNPFKSTLTGNQSSIFNSNTGWVIPMAPN